MADTILIGERINSSNGRVREMLEARDEGALLELARAQIAGGASFIDINASMLMEREAETLRWAADCIVSDGAAGVSLDSPNTDLLLDVAARIEGKVMLNSFTCDRDHLERACGAAVKRGANLIIMLKTKHGIPATVGERMGLADTAVAVAEAVGLPPDRVYIDPIFSPLATAMGGMGVALGTLDAVRTRHPGLHRIGGLSNISFGLPMRKLINRNFLAMALSHGLDAVICDTTDSALMSSLAASEALIGLDRGCGRFLRSYREKKLR